MKCLFSFFVVMGCCSAPALADIAVVVTDPPQAPVVVAPAAVYSVPSCCAPAAVVSAPVCCTSSCSGGRCGSARRQDVRIRIRVRNRGHHYGY